MVSSILVALCLVGTACGSSGGGSPTKAEFVDEANAICTQAKKDREVAIAEAQKGGSGGGEAFEESFAVALGSMRETTEEVAALSPPKGDEDILEGIIIRWEQGLKKLEAKDGPSAFKLFAKGDKLAKSYGITSCTF